jgi:hypothetical protein
MIKGIKYRAPQNVTPMPYLAAILVLCSLVASKTVLAQTPDSLVVQAISPLLKKVMDGPSDMTITLVSSTGEENIDIGVPMHTNHVYNLLKTGGKTYARIGATGITYQLDRTPRGDSVLFRRIDGTTHFGYNISAYEFSYAGRLYNIGGYGYWHWNGQLREFNGKMKHWQIIPLDRELPLNNSRLGSFPWLDKSTGRLYVLRFMTGNEAVKNNPIGWADTTVCLDMNTGTWTSIGKPPVFKLSGEFPSVVVAHDSGLIVNGVGSVELWSYLNNKVYVAENDSLRAQLLTLFGNHYLWFEGDKLFIGEAVKGTLDSIQIRQKDFADTGRTVYQTFEERNSAGYLTFGGVMLLGGIFWFMRGRLKRSVQDSKPIPQTSVGQKNTESVKTEMQEQNPDLNPPETPATPHLSDVEPFDAVERSLLSLLYENEVSYQRKTSTIEVNRILGVANKTLDMQKRKRSDVIRAVNRKFQLIHPDRSGELIMKNRSDMDGRLSEYYLNPAELLFIKNYIN